MLPTLWAGIRYRAHSAIAEWHARRFQKHWRAATRATLRMRGAEIEKHQRANALDTKETCSDEARDERTLT